MFLPKFNDTHREPLMHTYQKVPISFNLNNDRKYELVIKKENKILWKYKSEGRKGINQIRWDLILDKINSDQPYFIHYNKFINPGKYDLFLEKGDTKSKVEFHVYENI
jgi:hypothetical protein